jgi:hypothetical protein
MLPKGFHAVFLPCAGLIACFLALKIAFSFWAYRTTRNMDFVSQFWVRGFMFKSEREKFSDEKLFDNLTEGQILLVKIIEKLRLFSFYFCIGTAILYTFLVIF